MISISPATSRFRQTILCLALIFLFLETLPLLADVSAREAAEAAGNQGATLVSRGEHLKGIVRLQEAVSLYRRLGDKAREAECIAVIGIANRDLRNFPESVEAMEAALELYREIENVAEQAGIHVLLGDVLMHAGRHRDQADHWESALSIFRSLGDSERIFKVLAKLGTIEYEIGRYQKATSHLEEALAMAQNWGKPQDRTMVLNNLATIKADQHQYRESLSLFRKILRTSNDPLAKALALLGAGRQLRKTGSYQDAARSFEEALAISRQQKDRRIEAMALSNLGVLDCYQGRCEQALIRSEGALRLFREVDDTKNELKTLISCGHIYTQLGYYEEGLGRYKEALKISRTIGEPTIEMRILIEMAQLLGNLGRIGDGLTRLKQAVVLAKEVGDHPMALQLLKFKGMLYLLANDTRRALKALDRVKGLSQEFGDRNEEAEAFLLLGMTYLMTKQPEKALLILEQSLDIQRHLNKLNYSALTSVLLAETYHRLGRDDDMIQAYREAGTYREQLFEEIRTDDFLMRLAGNHAMSYSSFIHHLLRLGHSEEAFEVAERARNRGFLRQLGNPRMNLKRSPDSRLIEEEKDLRQRLFILERQVRAEYNKPFGEQDRSLVTYLTTEIDRARRRYEALLIHLKQTHPEYTSLIQIDRVKLSKVQTLLDERTTLIEYHIVGPEVIAWIIDHRSFRSKQFKISARSLEDRVISLRNLIASLDFNTEIATELYQILFKPLEPYISHKNLWIVPHGVLHTLPFAALWNPSSETYLVEDYTLSYLPSASVLPFILKKRNPNGGRALVIGDPDGSLPYAAEECRNVAELHGVAPLLGPQATESTIFQRSGSIDILHLATHAVFNSKRPLFSRIELTANSQADGNLEVHEIYGLDLSEANLVVLSACNTAMGVRTGGDDIVGLTRAFIYAGTPAVVTTLWSIDDAASGALMENFYRQLRRTSNIAEALRRAQLEVMADERWRSPYYWAAFTLTGDILWNGPERPESSPFPDASE